MYKNEVIVTALLLTVNCHAKSAVSSKHVQFWTALLVSNFYRNTADWV